MRTRCAPPRSRWSAGRRRWARSRSIPGRFAARTSTIRTSCGSTSTPSPAPTSRTRSAPPSRHARCWPSSGTPGFRRRRAAGASTSTSGSSRDGRSRTSATLRSRSDGHWSGAFPTRSPRAGGRRSAASASSSTTTRMRAIARSPRRTASAPSRARRCQRLCPGTSCPTSFPRTSRSRRCRRASPRSGIATPRSTTSRIRYSRCSTCTRRMRSAARATCLIHPTTPRCRANPSGCSPHATATALR